MSKKSMLDSIDVPAPCPKNWDEMNGDDKSRFCSSCEKTIHNLSELTRREARKILFASTEKVCVRMEREPDGKIKYLKKQFHQITRQTSIAAGVLSASLSLSTMIHAQDEIVVGTTTSTVGNKNQSKKTSQISFTVYDQQNTAIPDAEVKLISQQTKQEFVVESDDNGSALFPKLPHGLYDLEVDTQIFLKYRQRLFIKEPVEPNIKITLLVPFIGETVSPGYEIPIFQAIAQNDNEEVEKIIKAGFSVNTKNSYKQTALHFAVETSNLEIVKFLLDKKAKVNAKDKQNRTPLLMIEYEFDEDTTPEIVKLLIAKGANVNVQDDGGETALMFVCDEENLDVARMLLESGANPNLKNHKGETAFDKTNSLEIKNLLLKFGAKKAKK